MRSIRFLYVLGEGVTLLAAAGFIFLLVDGFQQDIKDRYQQNQIIELDKMDVLFYAFLEDNKTAFESFAHVPAKEAAAVLLTGFSDVYFVDETLKISRILKKTGRSYIFDGLDLSHNKLAGFLKTVQESSPRFSSMYRSAETEELSTYLALKSGPEWLVGRIGLENLRRTLQRIADYTRSILIIASKDGYVLSSSWEPLPFQVLPEHARDVAINDQTYFYARKSSAILDNDIVILTPHSLADSLLANARRFSWFFVGVIFALFLLKMVWQYVFFLRPLARFSAFIGHWSPEKGLSAPPVRSLAYQEITLLNDTFQEMTRRISTIFDQLTNSEAQLRASESRMRGILDSLNTGVCAVSKDTSTIIYTNPAMARILGLPPDQIIGQHCKELLCISEGDCPFHGVQTLKASMEGELQTAEARRIPVLKSMSPVMLGDQECMLESFIDLTALKAAEAEKDRLEEQLMQARKMEAIGKLAGGVAHDFNNLLQAINGYTDMALEELGTDHPVHTYLKEVAQAGARAADLVAQLLAFGRRQILRPAYLELNGVVTHLLKMLGRLIGEDIHLDFLPGHPLDAVYADRGMVEQILMNLCINARDAMPHGGHLTIATGNRVFTEEDLERYPWSRPGRFVYITITDTGHGMDEETLAHIFEPYFTTKEVGKGTGLGLATVYGIVSQHNGLIHARSRPGEGAAITVCLPAQAAPAPVPEEKQEGPAAGGNETILLAEDDESIRALAKAILDHAGYSVLEAANGREAQALFDQHAEAIHLLLLDVVMPEMGGRAVYDHAKQRKPGVRALFASGYNENAIHANFVLEEGLHFIQKPYERKQLLARVREILDTP